MSYLMGIDLGTSSVKALVIDYNGNTIAIGQEAYPISTPHEGYAEQDTEIWWKATVKSIRSVLANPEVDSSQITGIGLSGQMHGMVLLDKRFNVIRPAIIWCDQRSKKQVEEIYRTIGRKELGECTLNPVATGFQTASLLWIKENEPEYYEKIYKVILPKDYIRLRLIGEIGTDITDASSTLAFDTARREWSLHIIDKLGLNAEIYPDCGLPEEIAGRVTEKASQETGLKAGTIVTLGGGDQPMQAIGNGIVAVGMVSSTIGTGGQIFTPVDKPVYDPLLRTHTFCNAAENSWNIIGASLCAGLSLKWFHQNVYQKGDFKDIDIEAEKLPPGSEGLIFLPYLTGERTPHMDPCARGVFFGLSLRHNSIHMARAIMEGVVFALRDSLEIFKELGIKMDKVIASGGGAQSGLWLEIQADVFGREVYTTKSKEQACLGAAITAGIGSGVYSDIREACKTIVKLNDRVIQPDKYRCSIYDHFYGIYRELYLRNKDLFQKL